MGGNKQKEKETTETVYNMSEIQTCTVGRRMRTLIVPCAVECGNGVSIFLCVSQKLEEVVASDNSRRYDIVKGSHDDRMYLVK